MRGMSEYRGIGRRRGQRVLVVVQGRDAIHNLLTNDGCVMSRCHRRFNPLERRPPCLQQRIAAVQFRQAQSRLGGSPGIRGRSHHSSHVSSSERT